MKHWKAAGLLLMPKKHDPWFKESAARFKGGLPLVFFSDSDIVISPANVEFAE
jgi:hypothetical protein